MEKSSERPTCQATVLRGPRKGLPCSLFAGDGIFGEFCFRHTPEDLLLKVGSSETQEKIETPESQEKIENQEKTDSQEDECIICQEKVSIGWISSCCKRSACKACLIRHQDTVKGKTNCVRCYKPLNNEEVFKRKPKPSIPLVTQELTLVIQDNPPHAYWIDFEGQKEPKPHFWVYHTQFNDIKNLEEPLKALNAWRGNYLAEKNGFLKISEGIARITNPMEVSYQMMLLHLGKIKIEEEEDIIDFHNDDANNIQMNFPFGANFLWIRQIENKWVAIFEFSHNKCLFTAEKIPSEEEGFPQWKFEIRVSQYGNEIKLFEFLRENRREVYDAYREDILKCEFS